MTAHEARELQRKAIDRENLDKTIEHINCSIKESAESGESCVYIRFADFEDINRLKDIERKEIARYFRSQEFNTDLMSTGNLFDMKISWL